jgi:hypothetical protein
MLSIGCASPVPHEDQFFSSEIRVDEALREFAHKLGIWFLSQRPEQLHMRRQLLTDIYRCLVLQVQLASPFPVDAHAWQRGCQACFGHLFE